MNGTADLPGRDGRMVTYRVEAAERGPDLWACRMSHGEGEALKSYRVSLTPRGWWDCECPARRRWQLGKECKHIKKARELKGDAVGEANNAVIERPAVNAGGATGAVGLLTPDRIDLIKRTICKDATDDEMALFLGQCERTQLDPFSRQIHAVKRWDAKAKREVMTIQVGIDGFRLVAERTGRCDGQKGPFWCGPDGQWVDVWLKAGPPAAAKVVIYRKGSSRPYSGVAHWDEYKQEFFHKETQQWRLTPFWARMPAGQLAKCAEALALRKAFPMELSGLYAPEEIREERPEDGPTPALAAPATPAAPTPTPKPAPRAPVLQRLEAFALKTSVVHDGLVSKDEVLEAVYAALKGKYGEDAHAWPEAAIPDAEREAKAFVVAVRGCGGHPGRRVEPGEASKLLYLMGEAGVEFRQVCEAMGWPAPPTTRATALTLGQLREAEAFVAEQLEKATPAA